MTISCIVYILQRVLIDPFLARFKRTAVELIVAHLLLYLRSHVIDNPHALFEGSDIATTFIVMR